MALTAVSLFAGVGGFDIALERAGMNVVAACEIDANARGVLAHRFPNTQLFDDVRTLTGDELIAAGFNPRTGIIVGGFPCQDLSVAGKRAGLDGARSGLFYEFARLLDETKAQWFILENVPGLLSSNAGRDMGAVIGALAERGYGIAYRILDAQYFGVPQRRRRVFIVGNLGDDGRAPAQILAISEGRERYFTQGTAKREDVAATLGGGSGNRGWAPDTDRMTFVPYVKVVRSGARAVDGSLPAEVWAERDIAPTLNVMDNTGESRATVILFEDNRRDGVRIQAETTPTLQSFMGTGGNNMPMVAYPIDDAREIEKHQNGTGIGEKGAPAFTLDTRQAPAVAFHQKQNPISGDVSPALGTTSGGMGVLASVVRRLTPIECERLQGFPDNWTAQRHDFKKNIVISQADSSRYKEMGNAVAVPVVEWIARRLLAVANENDPRVEGEVAS